MCDAESACESTSCFAANQDLYYGCVYSLLPSTAPAPHWAGNPAVDFSLDSTSSASLIGSNLIGIFLFFVLYASLH